MRRIGGIAALALCLGLTIGTAWAGPTLVWDPNPDGEGVDSYSCYWGTTSRHETGVANYSHQVAVTTTSCELDPNDEIAGLYFAAVVARNAAGLTSDYSVEVTVDQGGPATTASGGGGGGGGCFLRHLSWNDTPR